MAEMVAYCGLTCQSCPIYLATRQENKEEQLRTRTEIIQLCKEHYGVQYAIERHHRLRRLLHRRWEIVLGMHDLRHKELREVERA